MNGSPLSMWAMKNFAEEKEFKFSYKVNVVDPITWLGANKWNTDVWWHTTYSKYQKYDKKTNKYFVSPKSKEELRSYVDFMAKQVSLDATHVAYKPVQTRYGTAVTGDLRGSLKYDGFRNTYSLIGYAVPTDKGVALQLLMSDDSSHDYWANELNQMYQTQSLKGGK